MRVNPTFTGFDEFAASGDKTEPSAGLKASGYLPLEMLPAQHFNWLMNRASKGVGESQTYIDNINKELNSVLTQEGLSPDNSTNQLLAALNAGFRDTKANGTSDLDNISVTGSYQFSASTTNAPSTSAGLLFHIQWPSANAAIQVAFGVVTPHSWIRGRTSGVWGSWFELWTAANDGTGSGLDADTVDGKHASEAGPLVPYTLDDAITNFDSISDTFIYLTDVGALARKTTFGLPLANRVGAYGKAYNCGGYTASTFSAVCDAYLHPSDTVVSMIASLGTARDKATGVGNALKGYIVGGRTGTNTANAIIEGVDFNTDDLTTVAKYLNTAIYSAAGLSAPTMGYIAGGLVSGGTGSAAVQKHTFATEVVSNSGSSLGTGVAEAACVWTRTAGYIALGTAIQKILYSTDAVSTLSAVLGVSRSGPMGIFSRTKGYVAGSSTGLTSIEALTFAGETVANISAVLSVGRGNAQGHSFADAGVFCGGSNASTRYADIDGLTFSGETALNPSAALGTARMGAGCTHSSWY